MISLAAREDLVKVADIACWYFYQCRKLGEFDREVWVKTWSLLLDSCAGLVLQRTNEGQPAEAIGVLLYPDPNDGKLAAYSAFWYVADCTKGLSGGLLKAELERLLKERGVHRLYMTALTNHNDEKTERHLIRAGYQPIEVVYGKELS